MLESGRSERNWAGLCSHQMLNQPSEKKRQQDEDSNFDFFEAVPRVLDVTIYCYMFNCLHGHLLTAHRIDAWIIGTERRRLLKE